MRTVLVTLACLAAVQAVPEETRLRKQLLAEYDPVARPASPSETVEVSLGMDLIDLQLDQHTDIVTLHAWMHMSWDDRQLVWDPEQYGGLTSTRFQSHEIWTPDLVPYMMRPVVSNDWLSPQLLLGYPNGTVLYVPPAGFQVRCHRDSGASAAPSGDTYSCRTKLGPWTYSAAEVDLKLTSDTVDTSEFSPTGDWTVESGTMTRVSQTYACCPDEYVSVNIDLVLKPRNADSQSRGDKHCRELATSLRAVLYHH